MAYLKKIISLCLAMTCIVLGGSLSAEAQSMPFVTSYRNEIYQGGQANRGIVQDKRGNIYFANSEGLLTFDGVHFELYPISNKTQVLAIGIDEEQRIFVGGQGDLGYFKAKKNGKLQYTSLVPMLLPEDKNVGDIRNILIVEEGVYFKGLFKVLFYDFKSKKINSISSGGLIDFLGEINGKIYIDEQKNGLYSLENNSLSPLVNGDIFKNKEAVALFMAGDRMIIASSQDGFYEIIDNEVRAFDFETEAFFIDSKIKTAINAPNGDILIGTVAEGLILLDENFQQKEIYNKNRGLLSNAIQALHFDQFHNLWIGLENGISYLKIGTPLRIISPNPKSELIGYATAIYDNRIYIATSLGLYRSDAAKEKFALVPNTEFLCWNLSLVYDKLLLHSVNGSFLVEGNSVRPLNTDIGSWISKTLDNKYLLEGTYLGINIYDEEERIEEINFEESCRIIEICDKYIWISHDYKGVYRLDKDLINRPDEMLKKQVFYDSSNAFPSNIGINVTKVNDEISFTTENGIYRYDTARDKIVPHEKLNEVFGANSNLSRLLQDDFGRIWFVEGKDVGYINVQDVLNKSKLNKVYLSELEGLMVEHFQHINPYSKDTIYFGAQNGVIEFCPNKLSPDTDTLFNVNLTKVSIGSNLDSVLFHGTLLSHSDARSFKQDRSLHYRLNTVRFDFSNNYFKNNKNTEYRTFLEGFDDTWTAWSATPQRTFTNLPYGKYIFKLQAKNAASQLSTPISYTFEVSAPWYLSNIAKVCYALLSALILFLIWYLPRRSHQQKTQYLIESQVKELQNKETIYNQKVTESENKIVALKNEKLKAELEHINRQLASSTMYIVQKGEMLQKIKENLEKINKSTDENNTKADIKRLIRIIDQDLRLRNNWENFEIYFNQIHADFTKKLREKHPNLTPKDHKLCAFLRMNLSSKEIAVLLNITTRSVEMRRYRLRKRLDLDSESNLVDYILGV